MIDETILLNYIRGKRIMVRDIFDKYPDEYNDALGAVEKIIASMPKEEPIIIKMDQEEIRNKLSDLEFERDFYKMHFEDLYGRKVKV